jgi:hypothetical protein
MGMWDWMQVITKNMWNRRNVFFRCTHFTVVDSVPIALLNITTHLPIPLLGLRLTILALRVCYLLVHSICHYTRLVLPWQDLRMPLQPRTWTFSLSHILIQPIKLTWIHLHKCPGYHSSDYLRQVLTMPNCTIDAGIRLRRLNSTWLIVCTHGLPTFYLLAWKLASKY